MPLAEDAARLAEKAAFFDVLALLEQDEHDHVDAGVKASMEALQRKPASSHVVSASSSVTTRDFAVNNATPTSTSSLKMLGIAATPAQSDPLRKAVARSLIRSHTLPEKAVASMSTLGGEVDVVKDTPVKPASVSAMIPQLRHSLSTPETMVTKAPSAAASSSKALGKRKRGDVAQAPEEHRLFSGLHFFFIPNDDIAAARRLRMRKAAEYGANRVTEWDTTTITHVIADKVVTYQDVLKYLRLKSLPTNIILVNDSYPADCLSYRDMIPPDQVQYRVKGTEQATKPTSMQPPPSRTSSSEASQRSLQVKQVHRKEDVTMQFQARTPSRTDESSVETFRKQVAEMSQHSQALASMSPEKARKVSSVLEEGDPLQGLIEQARAGGDNNFDSDADDVPNALSSDNEANNSDSPPPHSLTHTRKSSTTSITKRPTYACMRGGSTTNPTRNPNEGTISILQEMATMYDQQKDQWRTRAYRQAISTLRVQTHYITTAAEAKLLPNISDRLADKIEEIAKSGRLRRLESAKKDPEEAAIRMFAKIYGVGLSQATKWVQAGYRSIEELLAANVPLTENQRTGIAHYDDFLTRIPRAEVAMHGEIVRRALHAIDPGFEATIGGSYRRGAADSGDVDIVITKAGATASYLRTVVIDTLVPELMKVGFLTAGLATTDKDSGSKWHGASQLPLPPKTMSNSTSASSLPAEEQKNTNPWRRIDLLLVPSDEIGAAMIYFTGNDIFNRSMRLLARRKGMRLNQRGLYKDIIRGQGGTKLTEGVLVEGENERKIFEVLGVPWREATERNC